MKKLLKPKKPILILMTCVLSLFFTLQSQAFSGGDGSYLNPYQINTVKDLMELSNVDVAGAEKLWHKNYILTSDIVFPQQYESFDWNGNGSADWDINDKKGFSPIGDTGSGERQKIPFRGYFNGNGHYIKNLYIGRNQQYIGLFGNLGEGGVIEKLGIKDIHISYKGDFIAGALAARVSGTEENPSYINECCVIGGEISATDEFTIGGLIGYADYAKVTNCYTTINLHATENVGGIIGSMQFGTEMVNCYASGKLSNVEGKYMIGGVVSSIFGYNAFIENSCWDVQTTNQNHAGWSNFDGFFRLNTSDFITKEIFETKGWNFQAKWKMGVVDGDKYIRPRLMWQETIDSVCLNPYSFSNQKSSKSETRLQWQGSSNNYEVVYALQGEIVDPDQAGNVLTVTANSVVLQNLLEGKTYDCFIRAYTDSVVKSDWVKYSFCHFTNGGNGSAKSPYLISSAKDLITLTQNPVLWSSNFMQTEDIVFDDNEYNVDWNGDGLINIFDANGFSPIGKDIAFMGSYKGKGHVISNIYMSNKLDVAAPFGYMNPGSNIDSLGIENIYIKSNEKYTNAAGLVGYALNPTINSCYTHGYIDGDGVGGLIGMAVNLSINNCYSDVEIHANDGGGLIEWAYYSVTVNNCFAAGKVVYKDDPEDVGGFISSFSNSLTTNSCYWDINTTGQSVAIHDKRTVKCTGLETSKFSKESSFLDWDFWGVWKIGKTEFDNNYRPRLKWQLESNYILSGKIIGIMNANITAIDINTNQPISVVVNGDQYSLVVTPNQSIKITVSKGNQQFLFNELTLNDILENKDDLNFTPVYNIAFKTDTLGTVVGELNQTIVYGGKTKSVSAVPSEGHVFKYWMNENGDSIKAENPLVVTNVTKDSLLQPFFEIKTFIVQFSSSVNGSLVGDSLQIVEYNSSNSSVKAMANEKCHFVMWTDERGDSISAQNPIVISNIKADIKLIAIFELNKFDVQFTCKGNGILIGDTIQQIFEGRNASTIIALADSFYHFEGWVNSNEEIIAKDNPFVLKGITQDSVLSALFVANKYSILYHLDGGVNHEGNVNYYTIESESVLLNAPVKEGFKFIGWFTDASLKNQVSNPVIKSGSAGDIELFAKWEAELSIKQFEEFVSVYPNPTSSMINVIVPMNSTIRILNAKGQVLQSAYLTKEAKTEINMSQMNNGLYFIQVTNSNGTFLKKILKE